MSGRVLVKLHNVWLIQTEFRNYLKDKMRREVCYGEEKI